MTLNYTGGIAKKLYFFYVPSQPVKSTSIAHFKQTNVDSKHKSKRVLDYTHNQFKLTLLLTLHGSIGCREKECLQKRLLAI